MDLCARSVKPSKNDQHATEDNKTFKDEHGNHIALPAFGIRQLIVHSRSSDVCNDGRYERLASLLFFSR